MIRRLGGVIVAQASPSRALAAGALALWAGLALSGCAAGGPERVDVGGGYPAAEARTRETHHYMAGLVVFTETFLDVSDSDKGTRAVYSGYTIYDEQGRKVQYVSQGGDEPARVNDLQPRSPSSFHGSLTFWGIVR